MSTTGSLKNNGVYMFRNLGSGKYLNVYGLDQVSNNRNVCQWDASADLSQLWRVYTNSANNKKLVAFVEGSNNELYSLNVYRSVHKNADIYLDSVSNDPDSAVEFEMLGTISGSDFHGEKVKIRLKSAESDGSHLYVTAVGDGNGSSATTASSVGNVIWKAAEDSNYQIWVAEYMADYPNQGLDIRKYGAQVFLKKMYGSDIDIDAQASTKLCQELIRALQIELNIQLDPGESYGGFGSKTEAACPQLYVGCSVKAEIIKILCHAMFCKGYSPNKIYEEYNANIETGIKSLQEDIGLEKTGVVKPKLFKAILNTDGYALSDDGDPNIFKIQQNLNHDYWEYAGIYTCNGIFSRDTNKALIYALQKEEGIAANLATGTFGPSTTSLCPTLPLPTGSSLNEVNLVKILQYALYANGYYQSANFDGVFSDEVLNEIQAFQSFMKYTVKNVADMGTIKGLLASCGDTNRAATACDTVTTLTTTSANALYNAGYRYVGRYLTGTYLVRDTNTRHSKAMTRSEAETILNAGLNIIPIYQDGGTYSSYFTQQRGEVDAGAAIGAAMALGLPSNTTIYFAVDCDLYAYQVESIVANYFTGVLNFFNTHNANVTLPHYKIGVYGPRYTCTYICENGYAQSSYVSDMSTGYSGNLGYKMPSNWAFDQFYETVVSGIGIDKVAYSGRDEGVSELDDVSGEVSESQITAAILHKVCDLQEDIELLRNVVVPAMTIGVPVVLIQTPGAEMSLMVSETLATTSEYAFLTMNVVNGTVSATSKTEFMNAFTEAVRMDASLGDVLNGGSIDDVWEIVRGMGVSIQNGQITLSFNFTTEKVTLSICASTPSLNVAPNVTCNFSATLSFSVWINHEGGLTVAQEDLQAFLAKWAALNLAEKAVAAIAAVVVFLLAKEAALPAAVQLLIQTIAKVLQMLLLLPA